jgi:outer membrane receptor protein involved in Fe transport
VPNTNLKPEDYLTFEGGLAAFLFKRRLLVDLSAFHTSNGNYLLRQRRINMPGDSITYIPEMGIKPGLSINNPTAVFTSENGGVVRAYGGEASVQANVADYVRPWASYSLVLGSQHETPTVTQTGINTDYLANQAAHQVKAGIEVRPGGGFYLVPSFIWYSRTKIRYDAPPEDQSLVDSGLDPFFVLNVAARWERPHFHLWARFQNVLDTRYYRPGGPVSQQAATEVPQAGIMGQVGVRILY